jgi:hypothetical protein
MNEQELRAASLQIAVQLLGKIPEGSAADSSKTYKDYVWLAGWIQKWIKSGGNLFEISK